MITLDTGALAPHRPVEGRSPTGGGFGDILTALTAVTEEQPGALAGVAGTGEQGDGLPGDTEANAELAEAVAGVSGESEDTAATAAEAGAILAGLADHPGLQRRQLLALLATAAASGAADGSEARTVEGEVSLSDPVPTSAEAEAAAGAGVEGEAAVESDVEADAVTSALAALAATDTGGGDTDTDTVEPAAGSRAPVPAATATGVESSSDEVAAVEVDGAAAPVVTGNDAAGEAADADRFDGDTEMVERATDRASTTRPSTEVVDGGEPTLEPTRDTAPTSASRTVAGRSSTAAAYVERLIEAATRLENLPPPRQLTLELGEVRVRMALEDGALRVQVLGAGDAPVDPELQQDVERELRSRGFDLGSDAGGERRGADGEERPDPTWGPPHRARRGPARSVPTSTSDQHL